MQRHVVAQRPGYLATLEARGLTYNVSFTPDGRREEYFREGVFYNQSAQQETRLVTATEELFRMFGIATEYVLDRCPQRSAVLGLGYSDPETCTPASCLMSRMKIPAYMHHAIIRSWENDIIPEEGETSVFNDFQPIIYGRFDLRWDGVSDPQMYEYNADTPTLLPETAIAMSDWLLGVDWSHYAAFAPDQYNYLHEALKDSWRYKLDLLRKYRPRLGQKPLIHVLYHQIKATAEHRALGINPSAEDHMNAEYMAEVIRQAMGYEGVDAQLVVVMPIQDVHHNIGDDNFYDPQDRRIRVAFKLEPWEWMWSDPFGKAAARSITAPDNDGTVWIEPPYKGLWSNKCMLAVLWEIFKDDPERAKYLIPTWFEGEQPADLRDYVIKPVMGREGANITLVRDGQVVVNTGGTYTADGYIVQSLCEAPTADTPDGPVHYVTGVFTVLNEAAAICVRESDAGPIVVGDSYFVATTTGFTPHILEEVKA
jgi:glutathionylspermidine synthase